MKIEYKGYVGDYEYDEDAEVFHGRVVNLERSGIAFEAEREEDIEHEFRVSVDEHLKFCAEVGCEPERPVQLKVGST
ncbi:MAG: hypothetical protein ABIH23_31100 [bacterium]